MSFTETELAGILDFLRHAERLKATHRSAWTSTGEPESVAAHTWRLCLMALVLAPAFPGVDMARVLRILVVHDLGEAIGGDIPAPLQVGSKAAEERRDLLTLLAPLPGQLTQELLALWDEYEAAATPEARVAKGLDKLETILQHNQGANPPGFDYAYNLEYGRKHTSGERTLERLRAIVDGETAARAGRRDGGAAPGRDEG